jgi:hypothetical protein
MKLWLDDIREAPPDWVRVYWPEEAIAHLKKGTVSHVSLDHDLGDDARGTGYDVIRWIEEAVVTTAFVPPVIAIHSANPVGRERMLRGIDAVMKAYAKRA